MQVHVRRRPWPLRVAAGLAAVALVAGCGGASTGGAAGPAGSDQLGPENAATGEPVKIGWISTGQSQANDTTDEIRGAQAVAAYANARLGGLGGRPIELVTCEERGTPAGAQECGNQMVSEGVAAVAAGSAGQADAWLAIINAAGIPAGINIQSTQLTLSADNVFVFGNPLGPFGTPAAYARENGLTSAAVIIIDVPAASGPAERLSPLFFGNVDAAVDVIPVPPGTADMTPQIQAAQNANPGFYHLVGDENFCTGAIRAIRTLGIDSPVTALDRCIGENGAASIPGGYGGVKAVAQANTNPDDPEFQLYRAVIESYGDDLEISSNAASGYQGMLSLVRAVNTAQSPQLTPAGIAAALAAMPATPYPLGGGGTFQCNGTALPAISPNVCSSSAFVADVGSGGVLENFRTIDATGVYERPTG